MARLTGMPPEADRQVRLALPRLRLFWGAMLMASLGFAGLGVLASPVVSAPGAGGSPPLALALAAIGVLCGAAALLLDRVILAPKQVSARFPFPDAVLAQRYLLAGHLALWSLAQLPAILGFTQLLFDGCLRTHLALCAVSLSILALQMPTRARISTRLEAALR